MSHLFSPMRLRELDLRNRIWVSPMCQYSCRDGVATPWHMVHLGSRAVGGAALVMVEATAICPEGRISLGDSGLWNDAQAAALAPIAAFIQSAGAAAAIQLAHAGRKASTDIPWRGGKPLAFSDGGWQTLAPSALAFNEDHSLPLEMTLDDIGRVVDDFAAAARRALKAGFQSVEIHSAHGYLLHEFLSPLSNRRTDAYGGSLPNRMRLLLEVTRAIRALWPQRWPLLVRISATDWAPGGWDLPQSVQLAQALKAEGVDLIDCSSGGNIARAQIPVAPGYQVALAQEIRRQAGIATGAVGLITQPRQADQIIANEQADVVLLARAFLADPYWPLHAAAELGHDIEWPVQYARAKKAK
jgi:2,4-dienoyl-CoA reductase-like NADH-dependent reductase (Old Yellow Enzyme family)